MIIKCPECGHQVSDQAKTCPSCGIDIAGKITRCPDCGEYVFKEQAECPNCHCSINGASVAPPLQATVATEAAQPSATDDPHGREQQGRQGQQSGRQEPSRPPRKRRAGMTAIVIAFVISLIVVFLGIYFMKTQEQQNEQRAYENAMKSTEPLVLQNFLDMYKDASPAHSDSIKNRLEVLKKIDHDWADAVVSNTKFALERYMKLYPESPHNIEAKIKIDSLDWEAALKENTAEAFRAYLDAHVDGAYYDEARANYEKLEAQKITVEDRQVVSQLFTTFFSALAQHDEAPLSAVIAPVLTSFLHRSNATKYDVLQYMEKLWEPGIVRMEFTPNGDWAIEKQDLGDGRFNYTVNFTVVQHVDRHSEDGSHSASTVYKVTARVSPEGRITELNMKRSVAEPATATP